jgi:HEAT repeat protein
LKIDHAKIFAYNWGTSHLRVEELPLIGYVFMSYSRKDEEIMRMIAKFLRAQGIKVWVDNEKLIPGTPIWEEAVEKGIKNASAIVVLLSPDSKKSEWVRREISLADQNQKRVFPVLVGGDENSSITLRLINRQFVDIRINRDGGLQSLCDAISFYISELSLHENQVVEEADKNVPPQRTPEQVQRPVQKVITEKDAPKKLEQTSARKIDTQPSGAPARSNVFGWLTGGKGGEAKRLIAQLADATKRDSAAQELIGLGVDAVPALLEALQTTDLSLLPIYEQVLARIPSASSELIKIITTAHPIMRARAADVFAISKDKAGAPVLLNALQGEYFTVRASAAKALGRIGDEKAIQPLLKALQDPEAEVRSGACLGLGLFKDPSTFDEITNVLLDDEKIEVRQAAARALGYTAHPAALPFLMEALHDSYWWYEREHAAGDLLNAIAKMGTVAVEPLIGELKDKEGTVRKFAATLLGQIGDQRAIEPLGMALYDLHHEVGEASALALANFGARSLDVLVEALSHPEMWIRIHSVQALSKIKDSQIAPTLLEMLDDPEREVKKQVIQALGGLNNASVLPALQAIMSNRADREFHALAKEAMEKLQ